MAVTRSSAARARLFDLLTLPDELLILVARHALAMEVPAALRLLQTCKALHNRLGVVPAEAEALKVELAALKQSHSDGLPAGWTWQQSSGQKFYYNATVSQGNYS